jgi:hypothetical protein
LSASHSPTILREDELKSSIEAELKSCHMQLAEIKAEKVTAYHGHSVIFDTLDALRKVRSRLSKIDLINISDRTFFEKNDTILNEISKKTLLLINEVEQVSWEASQNPYLYLRLHQRKLASPTPPETNNVQSSDDNRQFPYSRESLQRPSFFPTQRSIGTQTEPELNTNLNSSNGKTYKPF